MNLQVVPRRRVFSCRLFVPLIALALLCAALAAPSLALAAEPGETDPARAYSEWPDDEFFVAQPELAPGERRGSASSSITATARRWKRKTVSTTPARTSSTSSQ